MGKVASRMKRPFQNFNVEDRAYKVISQDKPKPAPKHKVEQLEINKLLRDNPVKFEETLKKNEQLDKNLKNVFVRSEVSMHESNQQPKRPLPLNRRSFEEPIFGIVEPEKISKGKVSLMNLLKFVTNHQAKPVEFSAAFIAKEYSLPEETVRNVLKYCKPFEIYIPEDRKVKTTFAGPSIKRMKFLSRPLAQLEEKSKPHDNT